MKISTLSINNGLFLGIILIIFTLILSYTNPSMFLTSKSMLLSMPFILILIKAGREFRRSNNEEASFGELFNITFFCGVIAVSICSVFEFTLFNYINPELIEVERTVNLDAIEKAKSMVGEKVYEIQKEILKEKNMHSLDQSIITMILRFLTPAGLFSLIISLILRRTNENQIN